MAANQSHKGVYHGLPLDNQRFRLLKINPSASRDDPISCSLTVVNFGSRPKFTALSYMWGREKAEENISINGLNFEVGENLLDALKFLRAPASADSAGVDGCPDMFWIDAICIDQGNIEERNSQLQIMGQIYYRAELVMVWLGRKWEFYEGDVRFYFESPDKPDLTSAETKAARRDLAAQLAHDEYWSRLWILQEIGRARKIEVGFGTRHYPWSYFIKVLEKASSDADETWPPLRLNRNLVQRKYSPLELLLREYAGSRCSEPADKIYGLLGLATDAAGLPTDYRKSLYEIWKDVIEFMSGRDLLNTKKKVVTARLVRDLLTSPKGQNRAEEQVPQMTFTPAPLVQYHPPRVLGGRTNRFRRMLGIVTQAGPTIDAAVEKPLRVLGGRINLFGIILGIVDQVGPTIHAAVEEPRIAEAWRSQMQQIYKSDNDRQNVLLEWDKLISQVMCGPAELPSKSSALLGRWYWNASNTRCFWPQTLQICCESVSPSIRHALELANGNKRVDQKGRSDHDHALALDQETKRHDWEETSNSGHATRGNDYEERHLYALVLKNWNNTDLMGSAGALRRLGVACVGVCPGDVACWIPGSRETLLIRPVVKQNGLKPPTEVPWESRYRGTAEFTISAIGIATDELCSGVVDSCRSWKQTHHVGGVEVLVDTDFLFQLL